MSDHQQFPDEHEGEFGRPAKGKEDVITVRTTQRQRQLDSLDVSSETGHAIPGEDGRGTGQVDDRNKASDKEQHHLRHVVDDTADR
jgi:hypothetical protein